MTKGEVTFMGRLNAQEYSINSLVRFPVPFINKSKVIAINEGSHRCPISKNFFRV